MKRLTFFLLGSKHAIALLKFSLLTLIEHNNDILHPAQYRYRLDNSTQMALLNVINQIEGANIAKKFKHITFWDIRRAFDSIPCNLQRLAWMRLGVPRDVTDWFVELDDGGLSFIATPLYSTEKSLRSPEELLRRDTNMSASPA